MFAIQVIIDKKLYAAETPDGGDCFTKCFSQWEDVSYVREYLKLHLPANNYYGLGLKEAAKKVLKESQAFYSEILKIARNEIPNQKLDEYIFHPLHEKDDFDIPLLSAKAYGAKGKKSFLRIYAIRLSDESYLVIGGLIKLHRSLQDSEEGRNILEQLKKWTEYLRKNNIDDAFDIGVLITEP